MAGGGADSVWEGGGANSGWLGARALVAGDELWGLIDIEEWRRLRTRTEWAGALQLRDRGRLHEREMALSGLKPGFVEAR